MKILSASDAAIDSSIADDEAHVASSIIARAVSCAASIELQLVARGETAEYATLVASFLLASASKRAAAKSDPECCDQCREDVRLGERHVAAKAMKFAFDFATLAFMPTKGNA